MFSKLVLFYSSVIILSDAQIISYSPKVGERSYVPPTVMHPLAYSPDLHSHKLISAVSKAAKDPFNLARDVGGLESFPSKYNQNVTQIFVSRFIDGVHNEDVKLNFEQLVSKYGFPFEKHEVFTEDGYMLNLFRIPGHKPPIFLMHGLLGSADDFIIAGVGSGLAYILSEKGYDVWLGNARGNKYSSKHILTDREKPQFWDFSWHEIGVRDLPALIDYTLEKTNQTTLKYVGYSQGTTAFFVMASSRPEYNHKVSLMIAMAPMAFMSRTRSPLIKLLSPETLVLQEISRNLGKNDFAPNSSLIKMLKQLICGTGTLANIICNNPLFLMAGFDFSQINASNLPVVFSHLPSGASMKQLIHYGQGLISEDFRCFDYGSMENSEKYGSMSPPVYALERIVTPVSILFSVSDWLADPQDVLRLSYQLSRVVDMFKVPLESFSHLDFIIGKDVKELVYARIFQVLSL